MNPEQYFFRFAWPCTETLLQKKKITQQRFNDLKFAAEHNLAPSRNILEGTYKNAFENLKKIAKQMKKDYWDIEVIKKYFEQGEHNRIIESGHGEYGNAPPTLKEMCKISKGIVEKVEIKEGRKVFSVNINGKERKCLDFYNLLPKEGDKVLVHYAYIVKVL
ncbi:MAG: hypothetical protein N3D84_03610 [Candidatus Woesearchaeota archaeon]|nr:hypothetical protein [Candidatus Woesearchaeota archaeon]